ncbi:MAG: transposase [Cenarchaeum sp. SB0661_bin_35]|nr:transposase [Cenarchaeum sp. SB0661_bin_35]
MVEHDEGYIRAGSKGTKIDGRDGLRTIPSRRGLLRGPGRGTYKKDTPMMTVAYQRADNTERDCVVYNVHEDGKKLADIVEETVELGSRVYTDEYKAYSSLGKRSYEHETVNHSKGEYASGEDNKIHTNNCECLVGLLK